MHFDDVIDRRNIGSTKWDLMESLMGVNPDDGIAMWVADKDFAPPPFITRAAQQLVDNGHWGYFAGLDTCLEAVAWWQETRHGWAAKPDWMFPTFGLGHAIATLLNGFTERDDHVVIFTPVYHEFANKIRAAHRKVTELPLAIEDGKFVMEFDNYDALMTGRESAILISSPHNPAGRVWTAEELRALADFCVRHDLLLISDEVHEDLTFNGLKHLPMPVVAPDINDRTVVLVSASKTFSVAGARLGFVIVPDPNLRERFRDYHNSFNISPNILGVALARAAYSPEGAEYVDELNTYLHGNATLFNSGLDMIPGVSAMPMEGTYLAWADFAGTGMKRTEFTDRIKKRARIAATPGHTLGTGGESCMRFNIGTRRSLVEEAVNRLQDAFSDLQ